MLAVVRISDFSGQLLRVFQGEAVGKQQTRTGMSQIMESDSYQIVLFKESPELLRHIVESYNIGGDKLAMNVYNIADMRMYSNKAEDSSGVD